MNTPPDLLILTLKTVLSLLVILAAIVLSGIALKKLLPIGGNKNNSLIHLLANRSIGRNQQISLIAVPGAILVLGISQNSICLLDKIEIASEADALHLAENEKHAFDLWLQKAGGLSPFKKSQQDSQV
ncbi:MAG: flagellar biosynthetic protein FliO [Desulfococcaceae bacterium]|jgi:flagellar biogenesis protein FliO|nr:flagellar biosynthetic protein FliO [Desulfococcaceae bacterium]